MESHPMTRRRSSRAAVALTLVILLGGLPGLTLATRALQETEIFSPASGHAEVIAQGVVTLPPQAVWRAVFHSIDPAKVAPLPPGGPGFVLVDTGGVTVADGSHSSVLAPAEAAFRAAGPLQLTPL